MDKEKKRLTSWKRDYLCLGENISLIKATLHKFTCVPSLIPGQVANTVKTSSGILCGIAAQLGSQILSTGILFAATQLRGSWSWPSGYRIFLANSMSTVVRVDMK